MSLALFYKYYPDLAEAETRTVTGRIGRGCPTTVTACWRATAKIQTAIVGG